MRVATRALAMVTVNKEIVAILVSFLINYSEEEDWENCHLIMEVLKVQITELSKHDNWCFIIWVPPLDRWSRSMHQGHFVMQGLIFGS